MTAIHPSRSVWRSIGAVLAGLLVILVLSIGTDIALHASGVYPPVGETMSDWQAVLALVYRMVYAIAGCYVAARLAPGRPMFHAYVLGIVGVVVGTIGAITTWNANPPLGPHWYPLALVVVAIPCAWAGARLNATRHSE